MTKIKYVLGIAGTSAVLTLGLAAPNVAATQNEHEDKVTICHRTNSVHNPYRQITVNESAVDGEGQNDHTHHTGPVATSEVFAQGLKDQKIKWGDIIPPVGESDGLNWTDAGMAIYNNGCKYVVEPPVTPPVTPPAVQGAQVSAPKGGVGAGVGGATGLSLTTVLAAAGSIGSLGFGLRRLGN